MVSAGAVFDRATVRGNALSVSGKAKADAMGGCLVPGAWHSGSLYAARSVTLESEDGACSGSVSDGRLADKKERKLKTDCRKAPLDCGSYGLCRNA